MIYFSLPDFYNNLKINNFFSELAKQEIEKFKIPVNFLTYHGNFPFNSWNGGRNNCYQRLSPNLYKDFEFYLQNTNKPLRFNCTNLLLNEKDYHDNMNNVILSLFNNGCHLIEVADLNFLSFLEEQFPYYQYIFSNRANLLHEFDSNLINSILSFNKFSLIEIPFLKVQDESFLKNLNHKEKIELIINYPCPLICQNYKECQIKEDESQLFYSCASPINLCIKRHQDSALTLEEIKEKYQPLGFSHYKFELPHSLMSETDIVIYYVQYFIKPEYQFEIFNRSLHLY